MKAIIDSSIIWPIGEAANLLFWFSPNLVDFTAAVHAALAIVDSNSRYKRRDQIKAHTLHVS